MIHALEEDGLGFLCGALAEGVGDRVRLDEEATAFDCTAGRVVEDEATEFPATAEDREVWSGAAGAFDFFLGGRSAVERSTTSRGWPNTRCISPR